MKQLDERLYQAYYNWKGPWPADIPIPTLKEDNDKKIAAAVNLKRPPKNLRISELPPEKQEEARLYYVHKRRTRRSKKAQKP